MSEARRQIEELFRNKKSIMAETPEKRGRILLDVIRLFNMSGRCEKGAISFALELVESGVDMTVENSFGRRALASAIIVGSGPLVAALIKKGAGIEDRERPLCHDTPLMRAVSEGQDDIVRFLLNAGADPHARDSADKTAMDIARIQGRYGISQMLNRAVEEWHHAEMKIPRLIPEMKKTSLKETLQTPPVPAIKKKPFRPGGAG